MNRREFVMAAAGAPAVLLGQAPQPFHAGIVPAGREFWANCDAVSALGFHRVEFNDTRTQIVEEWSARAAAFKEELVKRHLALSGVALFSHMADASGNEELIGRHMRVGKFLAAVGGSYITHMIAPGAVLNEPADEAEYRSMDLKVWARQANEIGRRLAEEYRISLAYHPEQGEVRSGLFDRILEETDERWFRLLIDTGHVASGGRDVIDICKRWQKRLVCVHLKDFRADAKPLKAGNVPFGEGNVDLPGITTALREAGFAGWVMGESGGTNEHMRDYMSGRLGFSI